MKSWVAKHTQIVIVILSFWYEELGCKKGLHANAFGDEVKTKTKPLTPI
jgi:hypothetical protein